MKTIEEALVDLVNRGGMEPGDEAFAVPLAELVSQGVELRPDVRRAIHRMLVRLEIECEPPGEARGAPAPLRNRDGVAISYLTDTENPVLGPRLCVVAPFRYKDACRDLPGRRWHGKPGNYWSVAPTQNNIPILQESFPDAEWNDAANEMFDISMEPAEPEPEIPEGELAPIPIAHTTPWGHQLRAYHKAVGQPAYMLGMDMGTGKTKVAIDLLVNADSRRVIIQCPKSVMAVWDREFRVHAPDHFHVEVLDGTWGTIPKRKARADWLINECRCGKAHAIVINYEAAYRTPFSTWALATRWDYAIFDESHRIKSATGVQSKFCSKLRDRAKHRLALSGTPMAQSPLDIWGQYRALDPDVFGHSFTSFKYRYAIMGGWQGKQVVGMNPKREKELADLYYSIAYEVGSEVLDLPPSVDEIRYCSLERDARKVYDDIASDMYAAIGDTEVTTPNVLVKILRTLQVTGGSVGTDDGTSVEISTAKEELLREALEDINPSRRPVAVFCQFVADLDRVQRTTEALGFKYAELAGRRNDLDDDAHMPEWADVIGVQMQAGGVGIDLTRASVGIYYSTGHSLSNYKQSRARLLRPGQERSVLFLHLAAIETIDGEVMEALQNNQEVIDRVRSKGKPKDE